MQNTALSSWFETLKLNARIGKTLFTSAEQATGLLCEQAVKNILETGVSAVFCVADIPCAAIVTVSPSDENNNENLLNLYLALWNQGDLDFLLLLRPDSVAIYSLRSCPKILKADDCAKIELTVLDRLSKAAEIAELMSGLESGRLYEQYSAKIEDERLDATLMADLAGARDTLLQEENRSGDTKANTEKIHDVLLQAVFLLYLQDRQILTPQYIGKFSKTQATSLHELLRTSPRAFTLLLRQLDHDFNGGLFTKNPLWKRHAGELANFLEGKFDFTSQQNRLLRIYNFKHIPVELLSEIYDRFLAIEGGKKEQGAYYTPRRLAQLAIGQIWPSVHKDLVAGNIPRILDPACGSGIFLVTLFQRMANFQKGTSWGKIKQLAMSLHGVDINPTALRISAFSLSLAMLDSRNADDVLHLIGDEGHILPRLLGKSLQKKNFFALSLKNKYDYIVGNPPRGNPQGHEASHGNAWTQKNKYPNPPDGERSWPFIWKGLAHLASKKYLSLLLPASGFFLNKTQKSLEYLVRSSSICRLIDLSDLRNVLFKNAKLPLCILLAQRQECKKPYTFSYFCPKADLNTTRCDRFLLAKDDEHHISAWQFARNALATTQRQMWMGPIERRLLHFLDTLPTLKDLPLLEAKQIRKKYPDNPHPAWGIGCGFQAFKGKGNRVLLSALTKMPYATTDTLGAWVQSPDQSWAPYKTEQILFQNFAEAFTAPHIVMPLSLYNRRLKASYAEHDFSFNKSFVGITIPDSKDGRNTGKFLTAYLNSTFVAWYLGSMGLAVNRPRFTPSTIFQLPFPQPEDLPNPEQARRMRTQIIAKMGALLGQSGDRAREILQNAGQFPTNGDIEELDSLVFAYLGLSDVEIEVIRENVDLVRKAAQPSRGGQIPQLWKEVSSGQSSQYCQHLGNALTRHMADNVSAVAHVCASSQDIALVQIRRLYKDSSGNFPTVQVPELLHITHLPQNILQNVDIQIQDNIYRQRCVLIFGEDATYLVKPRQRRFWLTSAAYTDADRIMDHLLRNLHDNGDPA